MVLRVLLVLLASWFDAGGQAQPPKPAVPTVEAGEVLFNAGLSSKSTDVENRVGFWINIRNKTPRELSSLRLSQLPNNYELIRICLPAHTPACLTSDEFNKLNQEFAPLLAPGHLVSLRGEFQPKGTHKSELLNAVLEWSLPSSAQTSSITVALGENQVPDWSARNAPWIVEVLKGLAIPVTLALITLWVNNLVKKRESKKERQEKERDARSETLKQMLLVIHKYAAKYYLPLSRAASRAVVALHEAGAALTANPPSKQAIETATLKALFYVLLVKKLMESMRNTIGGVYFKDLRGEQLAANCLREFEKLLGDDTAPLAMTVQSTCRALKTNSTYESFDTQWRAADTPQLQQRLTVFDEFNKWQQKNPGALTAVETTALLEHLKTWSAGDGVPAITAADKNTLWQEFNQWLGGATNRDKAQEYLAGISVVLDYESNRPYKYWYNNIAKLNPKFPVDATTSRDTTAVFTGLVSKTDYTKKEIEDYLSSIEKDGDF
jgi:hypothetical protein